MLEILRTVGSVLFSIAGGGAIVFALSSWLGKVWANRILESDKTKYQTALEEAKAKYHREVEEQLHLLRDRIERRQFIHRLQFETEFRAYVTLWKRLIFAQSAALDLRPMFDHYKPGQTVEERKIERLNNFGEHVHKFKVYYLKARPFLAPGVFEASRELFRKLHGEALSYQFTDPLKTDDYWTKAEANANQINEHVELICNAIRERIGIIGEMRSDFGDQSILNS